MVPFTDFLINLDALCNLFLEVFSDLKHLKCKLEKNWDFETYRKN